MRLNLHKLVKPELEMLRENCNFTFAEMEVFNLLSKGISIREISMTLCMSEASVNRKIKNIRDKIERNYNYGRKDSTYLGES
jgi:DNA-binding NarL/FixJ family response regulator